jgi:ABC-type transporter Mla subunit MlaD
MTQAPLWIAVALFGVLVGATVPVLFLGRAVDEVAKTLGHVNRSADDVERVTKLLGGLYQNIGRTGSSLQRLKASLRTVTAVGASVGPMLSATAWR